MTNEGVVGTAARALLRSRLLAPPPLATLRLIREARRGGTNPYTLLAVTATRWPGRAAIVDDDGVWDYRQLQSAAESLARQLSRDGVGPGDAVGIMCRNGRGFIAGVFGAALVGGDVVLVNTDFRSDALAAAMSAHRITTMIADDEFGERAHAADESVVLIDPATVTIREGDRRPDVATPGRIILLTSGTTGTPKGVPRSPQLRSAVGVWVTLLERTGLAPGRESPWRCACFTGWGWAC